MPQNALNAFGQRQLDRVLHCVEHCKEKFEYFESKPLLFGDVVHSILLVSFSESLNDEQRSSTDLCKVRINLALTIIKFNCWILV